MRFLLVLALALPLPAQILSPILFGKSAAGGAYAGMGDVTTSNVVAAWGLRAYSAATRGNKLVNVCDAADAHCADILSNATTGSAVVPSSNPDCTGSACTIKIFYDLSGQTHCGAAACDLSQATIASRATLIVNCLGTRVCARRAGGSAIPAQSSSVIDTALQPYTISVVVARTGAFTTNQGVIYLTNNGGDIEFNNTNDTAFMYAGLVATATATNTTTHAFQAMFNDTASNFYIDGVANTVAASSSGYGNAGGMTLMSSGATALTGNLFEAAVWAGDQSASNAGMNSNQHSYWGF